MCGIAGFFSPSKTIKQSDLRIMSTAIRHRGPNADGFYFNEQNTVGLAHRRLSIIDLSAAANQPMYSACGRYIIVFNGEIYNYREIATELQVKLKTTSDTEVLVEAFAQWGEGFAHRLNGMFAFSIYDCKENKMYLYKDRIGIKPIFYYSNQNEFYFSSELKSFQALPDFNLGGICKNALHSFLHVGYIATPYSIYNNIKKFEAGCYAIIDAKGTTIKPYWKLEEQVESVLVTNEKQAKIELTNLLESAVNYRMISDVPFGTFLSGGVDSSLVTAIAQKNSSVPINTFSIAFEEQKFNEIEYARKVAKHLGTQHHEMICTYQNAFDLFDDIFSVYDEPFSDTSMFPTMLVSKFAREHVTMILSGDGGDEGFLGYGTYNWGNRLNNPLVQMLRKPISYGLSQMSSSAKKRAATVFNYPDKSKIKSHIFSQEQYCFSEIEMSLLINAEFKGALDMQENFDVTARELTINEEQSIFDLKYYMHDDLLVKVDRASMHYALEVRVPLLDYRVVKYAMNLHPSLRKKGDVSKYLLKEVLYDLIPRQFFDRPKWGFGMPVGDWLKGEWKHLLQDYLNKQSIEDAGVFNYNYVCKLVERFNAGEDYLYYRIWTLILFQKWYVDCKK